MKNMAWLVSLLLAFAASAHAATLKIATVAPDGTTWMTEMRAAADAVKAKTGDRVEIKYYPGGVMGDDATVLRKIKIGQLQGAAFTGGQAALITPDANIYSQPFEFHSIEEVDKVRAKVDPLLRDSFAKAGFAVPGITGGGFGYLMSVKEIKTKDDLKSAKVWAPQGDHIAEAAFKAAGVTPIPLPLADVYTSLQTGLIDTVTGTMSGALAFQWHTKVKHVLDLPVVYVIGVLVIDKKAFDALSADDQKVVNDEVGAAFARIDKSAREDDAAAIQALKKQGVSIDEANAADAKSLQDTGAVARKDLVGAGGISPELQAAADKALADAHK